MKKSLLLTLSLALILLPRYSFATPLDTIDDSDYGIQGAFPYPVACPDFTGSVGSGHCFFSDFAPGDVTGVMVGYISTVGDVSVTVSTLNSSIVRAGLVLCGQIIGPDGTTVLEDHGDCAATASWDLDVSTTYSNYRDFYHATIGTDSATFNLSTTIPASFDHGNEVAFLVILSDAKNPLLPVGATVSIESATAVPEPASMLLFGTGAAMLIRRLRKPSRG
jgi:hypothetical protein